MLVKNESYYESLDAFIERKLQDEENVSDILTEIYDDIDNENKFIKIITRLVQADRELGQLFFDVGSEMLEDEFIDDLAERKISRSEW